MDVLAEKARTKPPWAKLFADDLVLVSEMIEEIEVSEESESERYLFDPHKKLIQSNNEKQLGSGDPY